MLCFSCNPVQDIPEEGYLQHMKVVHNNVPQSVQPSTMGKHPVDPVFEQTLKEIEEFERQKKLQPKPQEPQRSSTTTPSPEPVVEKPIELTYVYTGTHNGHRVETLELDVDGKHFVIAFDPIEKKQVVSREVADLNDIIVFSHEKQIPTPIITGIAEFFRCDKCEKSFEKKRSLDMHTMRVHEMKGGHKNDVTSV